MELAQLSRRWTVEEQHLLRPFLCNRQTGKKNVFSSSSIQIPLQPLLPHRFIAIIIYGTPLTPFTLKESSKSKCSLMLGSTKGKSTESWEWDPNRNRPREPTTVAHNQLPNKSCLCTYAQLSKLRTIEKSEGKLEAAIQVSINKRPHQIAAAVQQIPR